MKAILFVNETYQDGQTDGMKLYKIETKKDTKYVFAANAKDAITKCKANLTLNHFALRDYLNHIY